MDKPKSINDLLRARGSRLASLSARSKARSTALDHVCAALPPKLAAFIVSAGVESGRLTVGVAGAAWAARLRYVTDTLRVRVGASMELDIQTVRIRVAAPPA